LSYYQARWHGNWPWKKREVVKVARDKSWGRIPWHIPERYQGTCSALVLFWPRYKE
jgi:hypothetical protein